LPPSSVSPMMILGDESGVNRATNLKSGSV
jgi:hypothetical protein